MEYKNKFIFTIAISILTAIFMLSVVSCVNSAPVATFSASDMSVLPGETKDFTLTVKNSTGKVLSNQMVNFKLEGTTQSDIVTTNSNGVAAFKVKAPINTGTYKITYTLTGLSTYSGSGQNNLIVSKPQAYFSGSDMSVLPGETKDFTLTVRDSTGKLLSNQMIGFSLQGTTQSNIVTTNSNGMATFKFNVPTITGTYKITYTLTGLSTYSGSGQNNLVVKAESISNYKVSVISGYDKNDNPFYGVVLKDSNGKPISGELIGLTVEKGIMYLYTNYEGVAAVQVNHFNKYINYKVSASHYDSYYNPIKLLHSGTLSNKKRDSSSSFFYLKEFYPNVNSPMYILAEDKLYKTVKKYYKIKKEYYKTKKVGNKKYKIYKKYKLYKNYPKYKLYKKSYWVNNKVETKYMGLINGNTYLTKKYIGTTKVRCR